MNPTARRKNLTPKQQVLALGGLFACLGLALAAVFGLGLVLGAELGEPCQGHLFACKNRGWNDARCLRTTRGGGTVCTRLCEDDTACPRGYVCDYGVWTKGGRDNGRGRVERICVAR